MKLRKTTKRWISMALTLLMMITSVFTGDYAIFAADSEEYTYADGFLVTEHRFHCLCFEKELHMHLIFKTKTVKSMIHQKKVLIRK